MPVPAAFKRLNIRGGLSNRAGRGPVLVTSWDQAHIYYLVVQQRKLALTAVACGTLPRDPQQSPIAQVRERLEGGPLNPDRLLLLLPRADLEMTTVEIPPAEPEEIAALIQAEVEQHVGDGEQELVVDYLLLDAPVETAGQQEAEEDRQGSSGGRIAVACSLEASELTRWKEEAAASRLQLEALSSRQMAPLHRLGQEQLLRAPRSVVIVVYDGEVELSFFQRQRLTALRTFRVANDELTALAEQIHTEVQRSLSLMDSGDADAPPERLILVRNALDGDPAGDQPVDDDTDDREATTLCEALHARPIRFALPTEPSPQPEQASAIQGVADPVLIGAADQFLNDRLDIDVLHPKRPPVAPNPILRWSLIGALAAGGLAIAFYTMLADVHDLRDQVAEQRQSLEEAERLASKIQEKADETRYVQRWLADQVDWLARLQQLSDQFPAGQLANVRRLSATTDGEAGVFVLSIQVNDPQRVTELENRLRDANFSITSQRISEQANNEEYPWQFEARIMFPILPLADREEQQAFRSASDPEPAEETP